MIDPAAVAERMLALEASASEAKNDLVADMVAAFTDIDPLAEGLVGVLEGEVARARTLANDHYAPLLRAPTDNPEVIGTVAFLQGVTFARAARDLAEPTPEQIAGVRREIAMLLQALHERRAKGVGQGDPVKVAVEITETAERAAKAAVST